MLTASGCFKPPCCDVDCVQLLKEYMLKTLHYCFYNIYLFDSVDKTFLESDALKLCNVATSGVPIILADIDASCEDIRQLLLPAILERIAAILDNNVNVNKDVLQLSDEMYIDVSVYQKAQTRLGASAVVTNKEQMYNLHDVRTVLQKDTVPSVAL